MIQRKQSVFLFLAFVAIVFSAIYPIASYIGPLDSLVLYVYQLVSMVPDANVPYGPMFLLPLMGLTVASAFIAMAAIFMFRNRKRQMVWVRLAVFLQIVEVGAIFLYYNNVLEDITGGVIAAEAGVYFIPVAVVFLLLGLRGVIADEKLIRSSERLR